MTLHPDHRDLRYAAAHALAREQGGVLSRPQLYAFGITRSEVRAHARARRWQLVGDQSVCLHNHDIERRGQMFAAVFQGGPRACLDGATALEAAGLTGFDAPRLRVSVPRGARVRRNRRFDIRQTRRWCADDIERRPLPRTRADVAAVRAALWAVSDPQAVLVMTMAVQQGVASPEAIGRQLLRIRRDRRRALLHEVVLDLLGGAQSLAEIDFARECRRRRLPEPTRQAVRRGRDGRYYLDVVWEEWKVVVEIDGIQHTRAEAVVRDALRHNEVTLQDAVVLHVPVLGLRIAPDDFFGQIGRALLAGGCPGVRLAS